MGGVGCDDQTKVHGGLGIQRFGAVQLGVIGKTGMESLG